MSLLDQYTTRLSELEGVDFERAVVARLLRVLDGFQPVPANPHGDGGLDGLSHRQTQGYCCFGMEHATAGTFRQRGKRVVDKFSADLRRLFEIEASGKSKFTHNDNDTLAKIMATGTRLHRVTLISNWFESNTVIGSIQESVARYAANSKCRFVEPTVEVVVRGPSEFADQFGADESTLLSLHRGPFFKSLETRAADVTLPEGPTLERKLKALAAASPPAQLAHITTLGDHLRESCRKALVFEGDLGDALPSMHRALEQAKADLTYSVTLMGQLEPSALLTRAQSAAEAILSNDFRGAYGDAFVRTLATGQVALLVGQCPIGWDWARGSDGH